MSKNPTKKPFVSYSEKLKDPRWQKKRLQVLERDGWRCQNCWDEKTTLHIHHTYYFKNEDPWDCPNNSLITLCVNCHKYEHDLKNGSAEDVKRSIEEAQQNGYLLSDVEWLINTIMEGFHTRKEFSSFLYSFRETIKEEI